jgi:hypothetical protein
MAGVEVLWQGCCCDDQTQRQLVDKVNQLGKLLEASYLFDGKTTYDNVLFSATVFEGEKCPEGLQKLDAAVYLAEKIGLFGCEIPVFNPPFRKTKLGHQPNHKMSFVFVRSQNPALNGRIVNPKRRSPHHPLYRDGGWMLESPSINLYGFSQDWMADFLRWVKSNYIPKLQYWVGMQECSKGTYLKAGHRQLGEAEVEFEGLLRRYAEQVQSFLDPIEESREVRRISEVTSKTVVNQGEGSTG